MPPRRTRPRRTRSPQPPRRLLACAAVAAAAAAPLALSAALLLRPSPLRAADETSSVDKLRILYASRFTFTGQGDPLVTIEIMGGQRRVQLSSARGLVALPDGDGGAEVRGSSAWTITLEGGAPAQVRERTVVERLPPERDADLEAALARWRARGHKPRAFETGSLFAVDGEVMDSRAVLVAIDPVAPGRGGERARAIAARHGITTEVHRELVRRPRGTIVARSGSVEVRSPSVLWFAPADPAGTVEVADVVTGGGGSSLATSRQDRRYSGRVYVAVGADGRLSVVNAISAERMLAGLVPSEIFPTAPPEALRAQAVAARTELLQKIGTRHLEDPFLLCSTQHCQVYAGAGHEHPRTTAAVEATRGLVLLRGGGKGGGATALVDARYSADCGGHGEHNDVIWGGEADPILRGRRDAPRASRAASRWDDGISAAELEGFLAADDDGSYCGGSRHAAGRHRWTVTVPAAKLDQLVAAALPDVGRVRDLEPLERGVSGRVRRLRVRGDRGVAVVRGDLAIRRMLGGLKSSLFTVRALGPADHRESFVFRGAGFGHGVGMCQIGAIGMAERQKKHRDILQHYYPGSRLHRLY
ncbi:MAG TPA: SpoIID/LytB domain-containing protein [Kofleriaceae bacterium]|nr:SpoIID/LytB domain-containing protein [Kofleriaceae bacterium]